eukprot:Rhum_TRINITY_DN3913_c0_g1::Rhum_TRINITY_DN3913_c0_g1_i1::g.12440::m.12440
MRGAFGPAAVLLLLATAARTNADVSIDAAATSATTTSSSSSSFSAAAATTDAYAWDEAAVVAWLGRVKLTQYAEAAGRAGVTGATLLAGTGADAADLLGVENPVHRRKVQGHVAALAGQCPCNTAESTGLFGALTMYRTPLLQHIYALAAAPRFFLLYYFVRGLSWDPASLVDPARGEVFDATHRPSNYTDKPLWSAEEAAYGEAAGLLSYVPYPFVVLAALVLPYVALGYTALPFLWTNWVLVVVFWLILSAEMLMDVTFWMAGVSFRTLWAEQRSAVIEESVRHVAFIVGSQIVAWLFPGWVHTLCVVVFLLYAVLMTFLTFVELLEELFGIGQPEQSAGEEGQEGEKEGSEQPSPGGTDDAATPQDTAGDKK